MGNYLVNSQEYQPEEPIFMVPGYYNFTPRQLQQMTDAGLQPGVPFRIGEDGAHRNEGPQVKSHIIDNPCTMLRKTLSLKEVDGQIGLRFKYSSTMPAIMHIFFDAADVSIPNQIRIEKSGTTWGPFTLNEGIDNEFDSISLHNLSIPKSTLITNALSHDDTSAATMYDIIIVVAPIRPEGAKPLPKPTKHIKSSSTSPSQSHHTTPASSDGIDKNNIGTNNTQLIPNERVVVMGEFTCFKITVTPENAIKLKFFNQRLQIPKKIYISQDIFGMDTNATGANQEIEEHDEMADKPEEGGTGEGESNAAPPALDTDSQECVICLTDPKEVVVYPCRHMCMCAGCAKSIPSQGNKCPMCRRTAALLLKISAPESPIGTAEVFPEKDEESDSKNSGAFGLGESDEEQ